MVDNELCRYLGKAPPAEVPCNEDSPCGRKKHSFYFRNVFLKINDIVEPSVATSVDSLYQKFASQFTTFGTSCKGPPFVGNRDHFFLNFLLFLIFA